MRRRTWVGVLVAGGLSVSLLQGPTAGAKAKCGEGTEDERSTSDDVLQTDQGTLYGNAVLGQDGGYLGWRNSSGYGEVGGDDDAIVEGQSADGSTSYSASQDEERLRLCALLRTSASSR